MEAGAAGLPTLAKCFVIEGLVKCRIKKTAIKKVKEIPVPPLEAVLVALMMISLKGLLMVGRRKILSRKRGIFLI